MDDQDIVNVGEVLAQHRVMKDALFEIASGARDPVEVASDAIVAAFGELCGHCQEYRPTCFDVATQTTRCMYCDAARTEVSR